MFTIPIVLLLIVGIYITTRPVSTESIEYATIKYYPKNDGTHFEVKIYEGGLVTFGREHWAKGEQIAINVKSDENLKMEVGIIPAEDMDEGWEYNDYKFPQSETIDVNTEFQTLKFEVPEAGEYGILIKNSLSNQELEPLQNADIGSLKKLSVVLEINKLFNNPLFA